MTEYEFTNKYMEFDKKLRAAINETPLPLVVKMAILKGILSDLSNIINQNMQTKPEKPTGGDSNGST